MVFCIFCGIASFKNGFNTSYLEVNKKMKATTIWKKTTNETKNNMSEMKGFFNRNWWWTHWQQQQTHNTCNGIGLQAFH